MNTWNPNTTFQTLFRPVFKWSDHVIKQTIRLPDILDHKRDIYRPPYKNHTCLDHWKPDLSSIKMDTVCIKVSYFRAITHPCIFRFVASSGASRFVVSRDRLFLCEIFICGFVVGFISRPFCGNALAAFVAPLTTGHFVGAWTRTWIYGDLGCSRHRCAQ